MTRITEPATLTPVTEAFGLDPRDSRFVRRLARDARELRDSFAENVVQAFEVLAVRVRAAFWGNRELLTQPEQGDTTLQARIYRDVDYTDWRKAYLKPAYDQLYQTTIDRTYETLNGHLGSNLRRDYTDPVARFLEDKGGTRMALLEVEQDTREAVRRALADGREAGDNVTALAERIQGQVPIGRFTGIAKREGPEAAKFHRARLIADTEVGYAQNITVVDAGESAGIRRWRILDGLKGPTDAECEGLMNTIVDDADEVRRLVAAEHPMGTRRVVPMASEG